MGAFGVERGAGEGGVAYCFLGVREGIEVRGENWRFMGLTDFELDGFEFFFEAGEFFEGCRLFFWFYWSFGHFGEMYLWR